MRTGRDINNSNNLVLRIKMNGAIPLLSLYAFTAWARKNLPIFFQKEQDLGN